MIDNITKDVRIVFMSTVSPDKDDIIIEHLINGEWIQVEKFNSILDNNATVKAILKAVKMSAKSV